jgi:asparagine synthetase B (glutamine-hydrolysing)
MSGIAGIAHPGKQIDVKRMLNKIAHRGSNMMKLPFLEESIAFINYWASYVNSRQQIILSPLKSKVYSRYSINDSNIAEN